MIKKELKKHGNEKGLYVYFKKDEVRIHKLKPGQVVKIVFNGDC